MHSYVPCVLRRGLPHGIDGHAMPCGANHVFVITRSGADLASQRLLARPLNDARDAFEANWLADVENGKLTFGGKRLAVPSDMEVTHGYNFGKHSFALRQKAKAKSTSGLAAFLK